MSVKGDGLGRNSHLKPPVLTSTWYGSALGGERSDIVETIFLKVNEDFNTPGARV